MFFSVTLLESLLSEFVNYVYFKENVLVFVIQGKVGLVGKKFDFSS